MYQTLCCTREEKYLGLLSRVEKNDVHTISWIIRLDEHDCRIYFTTLVYDIWYISTVSENGHSVWRDFYLWLLIVGIKCRWKFGVTYNWFNPGKIIIDYNKTEELMLVELYKNLHLMVIKVAKLETDRLNHMENIREKC